MLICPEDLKTLIATTIIFKRTFSQELLEKLTNTQEAIEYSFSSFLQTTIRYSVMIHSNKYDPVKVYKTKQVIEHSFIKELTIKEYEAISIILQIFYDTIYNILLSIFRSGNYELLSKFYINVDLPDYIKEISECIVIERDEAQEKLLQKNDTALNAFMSYYRAYQTGVTPKRNELETLVLSNENFLLVTILYRFFKIRKCNKITILKYKGRGILCQ